MSKKKLQGFTLVELVIVMAIFSIVMYSVTNLIDPVSKFLVRSSNFESQTAWTDNFTRMAEGNLQYADRIRVYNHFYPGDIMKSRNTDGQLGGDVSLLSANLQNHIKEFYGTYFANRAYLGCRGQIHVLIFDNGADSDANLYHNPNNYSNFTDFLKDYANTGKISRLTFEFDNYDSGKNNADAVLNNGYLESWVVNQKLYGHYNYSYELGNSTGADPLDIVTSTEYTTASTVATTTTTVTDESGNPVTGTTAVTRGEAVVFNPSDFLIRVEAHELFRDRSTSPAKLIVQPDLWRTQFACAMRNVLDKTNQYAIGGFDRILVSKDPDNDGPECANPMYELSRYECRYDNLKTGSDVKYTGFYFIYTLPDEIYNLNSQLDSLVDPLNNPNGYVYPNYNRLGDFDDYIQTWATTTAGATTETTVT